MREDIIFGFIFIAIVILIGFYIDWVISKPLKCFNGEEHDWKFDCNSKGSTGDLGLGIRGSWDIDYYRCSKCGKEKEIEKY